MAGLCLANVLAAGPASATGLVLSLAEVIGSEDSYSADGSPLRFSDFELRSVGDEIDLDLFWIRFDELGFRITGPFHAHKGDVIDLALDYVVESDQFITEASLGVKGLALGRGASVSVSETFEEFPDATLEASIDQGLKRVRDSEVLGTGQTTLHVTKNILLESVLFPNGHGHGRGHDDDDDDDDDDDRGGHGRGHDDDDEDDDDGDDDDDRGGHGRGHDDDDDEDDEDDDDDRNGHGDGHDDDCDCSRCHRSKIRRLRLSLAHVTVIEQHFRVDPIPEPGSGLLVGVGLAGLALVRARSRSR